MRGPRGRRPRAARPALVRRPAAQLVVAIRPREKTAATRRRGAAAFTRRPGPMDAPRVDVTGARPFGARPGRLRPRIAAVARGVAEAVGREEAPRVARAALPSGLQAASSESPSTRRSVAPLEVGARVAMGAPAPATPVAVARGGTGAVTKATTPFNAALCLSRTMLRAPLTPARGSYAVPQLEGRPSFAAERGGASHRAKETGNQEGRLLIAGYH